MQTKKLISNVHRRLLSSSSIRKGCDKRLGARDHVRQLLLSDPCRQEIVHGLFGIHASIITYVFNHVKHHRVYFFYYICDMKTLAERLVWARTRKQLSQDQLAKLAGVSQSTIGNLEAGIRNSARKITSIALALEVSAAWLAEGLGAPEIQDQTAFSDETHIPANAIPVRAFQSGDSDFVEIQKVKLKLSAGISGFGIEPLIESGAPIVFQKEWLERHGYFADHLIALKIRGESMRPKLDDGDLVVINTADRIPKDNLVYAVNFDGEDIIKRLRRENREWWLVSDNPDQKAYPKQICKGACCIIIGQVIYMQSRSL